MFHACSLRGKAIHLTAAYLQLQTKAYLRGGLIEGIQ